MSNARSALNTNSNSKQEPDPDNNDNDGNKERGRNNNNKARKTSEEGGRMGGGERRILWLLDKRLTDFGEKRSLLPLIPLCTARSIAETKQKHNAHTHTLTHTHTHTHTNRKKKPHERHANLCVRDQ